MNKKLLPLALSIIVLSSRTIYSARKPFDVTFTSEELNTIKSSSDFSEMYKKKISHIPDNIVQNDDLNSQLLDQLHPDITSISQLYSFMNQGNAPQLFKDGQLFLEF